MLIRRILRDDAWKVFAFTAILIGNVFATILSYPTFEQNYEAVLNFVPGFMKHLRDQLLGAGSGGLSAFAAINHLFKGANVIGVAAAVLLAMGTIAREVEIGTAGMLLSRPLSRRRILLSFAFVHLLELATPIFLATVLIPALSPVLIERDVAFLPLLRGAVHASVFLALVYAIALFVATIVSEQLKVAGIAGGICVVSFILYFVDQTRPYTLYRLSSIETYSTLARGGPLDLAVVGGMLAATAVLIAVTLRVFGRRDF